MILRDHSTYSSLMEYNFSWKCLPQFGLRRLYYDFKIFFNKEGMVCFLESLFSWCFLLVCQKTFRYFAFLEDPKTGMRGMDDRIWYLFCRCRKTTISGWIPGTRIREIREKNTNWKSSCNSKISSLLI